MLDAAGEADVPLPATAVTRESTNAARALGHGDEDMMALLIGTVVAVFQDDRPTLCGRSGTELQPSL